jgi:2-C-methyl-D-erythritol 4-phosphate cytidylyltransferase
MGNRNFTNNFTALIPAAGSSSRMGEIDKLTINLGGKPLLLRTIEAFQNHPFCHSIIIVTASNKIENVNSLLNEHSLTKVRCIIEGGKARQESVLNGLLKVETDYVAIHDGARPFITENLITLLFNEAKKHGNCIPVLPVKDTIKIVGEDGFVINTPNREKLFLVQTPQFFITQELINAYKKVNKENIPVTDEASILELSGYRIKTIQGIRENIKITTPEDICIAQSFITNFITN